MSSVILVFAACFLFWVLLAGRPTALSLALGALSAVLVAVANRGEEALSPMLRAAPRFCLYLPWLLKEIVVANLQVARLVMHPRLPIDPVVVRYDAPLRGDLALTTLANSITLTPGTLTVEADEREQRAKGAAAVADGCLCLARRLAEGDTEVVAEEVRVVAKAVRAARLGGDLAAHDAHFGGCLDADGRFQ